MSFCTLYPVQRYAINDASVTSPCPPVPKRIEHAHREEISAPHISILFSSRQGHLLSLCEFFQCRIVALVHLLENRIKPRPPLQSSFSILLALLPPLTSQALVDFGLDAVAASDSFVEKSACVTFVQGRHNFLAACEQSVLCLRPRHSNKSRKYEQ
jgi:hypothetical protein